MPGKGSTLGKGSMLGKGSATVYAYMLCVLATITLLSKYKLHEEQSFLNCNNSTSTKILKKALKKRKERDYLITPHDCVCIHKQDAYY